MVRMIRDRKGFTLVELMIVVAIIGILAAIAIPNFLQFRLKAKASECKSNLGAIRSTEVAYFSEWNFYVGGASLNPRVITSLNGNKAAWNANTTFSLVGFRPEGQVFYSYTLEPVGTLFNLTSVGYTSVAYGDLNADGRISTYEINASGSELLHGGASY